MYLPLNLLFLIMKIIMIIAIRNKMAMLAMTAAMTKIFLSPNSACQPARPKEKCQQKVRKVVWKYLIENFLLSLRFLNLNLRVQNHYLYKVFLSCSVCCFLWLLKETNITYKNFQLDVYQQMQVFLQFFTVLCFYNLTQLL